MKHFFNGLGWVCALACGIFLLMAVNVGAVPTTANIIKSNHYYDVAFMLAACAICLAFFGEVVGMLREIRDELKPKGEVPALTDRRPMVARRARPATRPY